ncbi:endo-1,4-beta-xylanase [Marchantia polymorpha subsp. ruderalis]|uniref:GH10 domain-containing protein n=2 Tax=Marchantia polymorpha TaxID=3197 RepID=A0AAF6BNU0_MARPO|nr:hypothetical protein MARPO_0097s0091 [Marchantia polymorpha]BBN13674.1 hypothetical protein Mp_6g05510 [Marchantia polymorpha subsp. ruderalis]|eukprot:PTQ32636.1 hypothetical protein MARPO_0097s0091 [Marchantia polymorpha]
MSKFFHSLGRKGKDLVKKKLGSNENRDSAAAAAAPSSATRMGDSGAAMYNIMMNPTFDQGTQWWFGMGCSLSVNHENGSSYGVGHGRTETWQGIAQEIGERLVLDEEYRFEAWVGIGAYGPEEQAPVTATVKVETESDGTKYNWIGSVTATKGQWVLLSGKFKIDNLGKSSVLYIEGPPSGVDVLVSSVAVIPTTPGASELASQMGNLMGHPAGTPASSMQPAAIQPSIGLLHNPTFDDGLKSWTQKGCKAYVTESLGAIGPETGKYFAVASQRTETWQGIEQDITGRIEESTLYHVSAKVRVNGGGVKEAMVMATLYMKGYDGKEQYMTLGRVNASSAQWSELKGEFLVNKLPARASIYMEGPPGGVDVLYNSIFCFKPERPKVEGPILFQNPRFGTNIVHNTNFDSGLKHWYPQGNCRLSIAHGCPTLLGPAAQKSFMDSPPPGLRGSYLLITNRSYDWEGPAQTITERLQTNMSYQVSAWVATRSPDQPGMKHKVDVCLSVDGKWVQGGEVLAGDVWEEVVGSFRLEKQPENVHVYLQGPGAGVDVMLAGLHIFAVDRSARFPMLRERTDQIRKRDVVVKLQSSNGEPLAPGTRVTVRQNRSSFPLGSAINHYSLENSAYTKFFLDTFNWAVFENELKWGWIEKLQGELHYENADDLLQFCERNGIPCRGHCILWETEDTIQDWLKPLAPPELEEAVHSRIAGLLSRYKGRFRHYDVNNEMLHGSYYKDRLGPQFLPYLFQLAHQVDPEAVLFVNDYHIEDGCDCKSSPTAYVEHIVDLIHNGAPIGGIGLQGHIDVPVGPVIQHALDHLATLGLPIWFTEIDVESVNEFTRADDLEVLLREAFAHPAIEGLMFWGFWEGTMCRKNAHLVDSDKRVNEAGLRLLALKEEWQTSFESVVNEQGEVPFRGFLGDYTISVDDFGLTQTFELVKGDEPAYVELSF